MLGLQAEIQRLQKRADELTARLGLLDKEAGQVRDERDRLVQAIGVLQGEEPSPVPVEVRHHTGKYRRLWEWLRRQQASPITVTFAEIEDILEFGLPPSARRHLPHWYGYGGSAVARAIQDAGWRVRRVSLKSETLEFHRMVESHTP